MVSYSSVFSFLTKNLLNFRKMILNIGQTLTAFQWPTDASANPFKPPETISVIFIMKVRSNFPWGGAVPSGTVHQR